MQIPRYLARAVHSAGEDRASDLSSPPTRPAKNGAAVPHQLAEKWVGTRDQLVALASTEPVVVDTNPHLSAAQKGELQHLIGQFSDVFSPLPGQTNIIQHDIQTPPRVIVRQRPYQVPEARRRAIEEEIHQMLKLGVIEPSRSRSSWSQNRMAPSVSATTIAA